MPWWWLYAAQYQIFHALIVANPGVPATQLRLRTGRTALAVFGSQVNIQQEIEAIVAVGSAPGIFMLLEVEE